MVQEGEWVIPVWPSVNSINGSPATPYIFDDRVNNHDVADAIYKMYEMGKDERKRIGLLGREYVKQNFSSRVMCEKMIEGIEDTFKNYKPRKKYDLYKII